MNKFCIALIILAFISCNFDLDSIVFKHFQKFIKKYEKKYDSINEFLARYEVFRNNIMNSFKSNDNKSSHKNGITQFSDLTQQEFKQKFLNLNYDAMAITNFEPYHLKISNEAPDSLDWRSTRVTDVKNQGMCSAAWAFSTVGNLEGLYAAHYGELLDLSESVIIDCDTNDNGCNGGLMEYAFKWLVNNGIMTEADYPYSGHKGECTIDIDKCIPMTITGFKKLGSSSSVYSCCDEEEMKEFLYEIGPLSIAFNANPLSTYASGIIDLTSAQCPPSGINHAALLVGYGTDSSSGLDYWIVKNSWGKTWGESGYFRIRRGNGTCGINCYVVTATVSF